MIYNKDGKFRLIKKVEDLEDLVDKDIYEHIERLDKSSEKDEIIENKTYTIKGMESDIDFYRRLLLDAMYMLDEVIESKRMNRKKLKNIRNNIHDNL